MSIADEIAKLQELRQSGALSEEEFAKAKAAVLEGRDASPTSPGMTNAAADSASAAQYVGWPPHADFAAQGDANSEAVYQEARQWAMLLHFSLLAGFVIPFAGLIVPVIIWQLFKDKLPGIDEHGKTVVNWIISAIIYGVACVLMVLVVIGIPLLIALGICAVVFPIIGGIKANSGEVWKYPMSMTFFN